MNYRKKSIRDVELQGKKVLLRVDFNVPQDKATHAVTSDVRIRAALPTIQYLLDQNCALVICSHLGKPKGEVKSELSLAPVAACFEKLLGRKVIFAADTIGEDAKAKAAALKGGEVLLLENTRFDPREEKNDPEFSKALASLAEVYVSDAFGAVHRAHASTAGVADYLPAYCGFLVEKVLAPAAGRLSVGLGVVVASLAVLAVAAVWAVFRWRNENRICARLFSVAKGLMDGLRSCLRMEGKGSFMLLTLLIWTMYWLNSVCILAALPQIGGLGLLDALFLMAAGSIASVVPVPGGFGAYHYLVALAMSTLYGLPWETGILFATLSHESQALTMVISGAASYVSESVASKKNN